MVNLAVAMLLTVVLIITPKGTDAMLRVSKGNLNKLSESRLGEVELSRHSQLIPFTN